MTRPKGTGGIAKSLTPEEIRRLRRTAEKGANALRNVTLIDLALGTGMRIGEVVSLSLEDVYNTKTREVLHEIVLEKHSTKACTSRTVAVAPFAQVTLQRYIEHLSDGQQLFDLTPNAAANLIHRLFIRAGVPNASSHSFRRTHADTLRRMGVDLHIIQHQLGHSSLAMTERYFAVDPAEVRSAVDRLDL